MVREQKFRGKKLEFTELCARAFKYDFAGSAAHLSEIGSTFATQEESGVPGS